MAAAVSIAVSAHHRGELLSTKEVEQPIVGRGITFLMYMAKMHCGEEAWVRVWCTALHTLPF